MISLALGALMVALIPLLKWYVEPRVLKIPLAPTLQQSFAAGLNVKHLDVQAGVADPTQAVKTSNLDSQDDYRVDLNKSTDEVIVFDHDLKVSNRDGHVVTFGRERFALDRRTGEFVHGPQYDETINDVAAVPNGTQHEGLIVKFPFGTEQQDYPLWVAAIGKSLPAKFVATDSVQGLDVYKFELTVPETEVGDPVELPALWAGEGAQGESLRLQMHYSNTITYWVEPATGVIVNGQQQRRQVLEDSSGAEKIVAFDGRMAFTDEQVTASLDRAKESRGQVLLITTILPIIVAVLGVLFLGLAIFLLLRANRGEANRGTTRETADA
ncbi:DUF3068 domain-containing protein [Actinokineospora sp.]|uniref:DUF3068 domain-containing protein n=1 Tax=Actinokineospora sp. TaxID=1872133 RepID=UPI0040381F07